MSQIVLKNVTKRFTTKTLGTITAVDNFNLAIEEGECFSFLGPSGCGKTTTLRMIAGFEDLSEGEIELCGRTVSNNERNIYIPPEERKLGMVFQAFAVWPHMNIFDNVAFPLKVMKMKRSDIKAKVSKALAYTKLKGMERVYPSDLSGGQLQRIALARAIVTNPKVMLLDEPLSNLDPKLRESMRFEIKELQKKFNFTIIFVTHDQSEAMALSDRMMVMDMGRIMQVDKPVNLYNNPTSRFVHSFLGQSTFINVNIKDGKVYPAGDHTQAIPCDLPTKSHNQMILATRPNEIVLNREKGFKTMIQKRIFMTDCTRYMVRVGKQILQIEAPHWNEFKEGDTCYIDILKPMWYEDDGGVAEKERLRRQLI